MIKNHENLTLEIKRMSDDLRRLEHRLKTDTEPDALALVEFRQVVDNVRLTAWGVSGVLNEERIKKDPNTVLVFLSAERLRRFEQLVKSLCGDIERGLITAQTNGIHSLFDSLATLQERLTKCFRERGRGYKLNDAAM